MKNVTAVFIQHDWGHDTVNYYRVQEYKSDIKKYFYFIRYQSLVPFSYFSDLQLLVWNAYYVYSWNRQHITYLNLALKQFISLSLIN